MLETAAKKIRIFKPSFFGNQFFVLKISKNAMKNMKISLKMKGDVMSNQFLMLWFQKDSLDTIGLRTYGGGSRLQSPKPKSDIQSPKCA